MSAEPANTTTRQWTPEAAAERAHDLYNRDLKQRLEPAHLGKFVVLNLDTGEFELGADYLATAVRARDRWPEDELFHLRVGHRTMGRLGARPVGAR